jgi:hypothetical protein
VRLTEHNGVPVTLEHVQWETVAPGSNKEAERGFVSRLLSSSEIESLLGCSVVPAGGTITLCSLPIESPALGTESLVLKVSGRDASGHAVTAWCTLERVRADERRQIADQHGEPGPEVVATRR